MPHAVSLVASSNFRQRLLDYPWQALDYPWEVLSERWKSLVARI